MEALSSCSILKSACDGAAISCSFVSKTASMRSTKGATTIRGRIGPQLRIEDIQRDRELKSTLSRRDVMFTGLSTIGVLLLSKSSSAEEVNDKDFKEKLLEGIDNLQQLVSKSFGDAKEAVKAKAEEAMSTLNFGDDKAADTVTEVKSTIDETSQQDKLAQN